MSSEGDLVSTEWLVEHLRSPDVRIVDATWHMPDAGRNAFSEYTTAHIPGAVFFDIDEIADLESGLPHTLPSPEKFANRMRKLGLGDGTRIVVYDNSAVRTAARAWWMMRTFGHEDVAILDGGLQKWRAEGRPLEDLVPPPRERHFTVRFDRTRVRDVAQMMANLDTASEQVVDARSPGRFAGAEPEPRPGLRAGHIPGSRNLHYAALYNEDGTFKTSNELAALFAAVGIDIKRPVATSCGSGVTACALAFALQRLGARQVAVYDGSWTEWGSMPDTPLATGAAKP